jgi:hypothetical protein
MKKAYIQRGAVGLSVLVLFALLLGMGLTPVAAQIYGTQVMDQVQYAVRQRVEQQAGRNSSVYFNNDAQEQFISNRERRITGTGIATRNNGQSRNFSYQASIDNRRIAGGGVYNIRTNWQGGWYSDGNRPGGNWPGGNWPGNRPGVNRPGGWNTGSRPNGRAEFTGPIVNRETGKVLDVAAQGYEDGANVQQWEWANQNNQVFEFINVGGNQFAIVGRHSGKVLDVADNAVYNNGANVQQYSWSGRNNQRWRIENRGGGFYQIVNVASRKCLDVERKSRDNGANIHQWDCNGDASQQWRLGSY